MYGFEIGDIVRLDNKSSIPGDIVSMAAEIGAEGVVYGFDNMSQFTKNKLDIPLIEIRWDKSTSVNNQADGGYQARLFVVIRPSRQTEDAAAYYHALVDSLSI